MKRQKMKGCRYAIGRGNQKLVLANYCEVCGGYGEVQFTPEELGIDSLSIKVRPLKCAECGGLGFVPTPDGMQILAMVHDFIEGSKK